MKIDITGFLGAIKQFQSKLLPAGAGTDSRNQNPVRGDLRAWRDPLNVATVPSGRHTIYRMGRDVNSDANYWLSWTTRVHAVRGFIASDTTERTYYTGSGTPKVTDNIIGLASAPYPTAARELGVPKPSAAATLAQSVAGTGDDETRYYVQTFITDAGEESAPSAAASITCKPGAIIDLSSLPAVPAGNYGITTRRIYRTQTTSSGSADYFFLRDILSSLTTTQDDARALGAGTLKTNGPLDSVGRDWQQPPSDLKCLTVMWNGVMAGITGRSVRFCEPDFPYAWPPAYEVLTGDVTPIALVVWEKNLLVLTTGRPYIVNGDVPEGFGDEPLEFDQSCLSEPSAVALKSGAAWAAPDGLAFVGSDGRRVILTAGILSRDDWIAMKPETIVACQYEGAYMGFYTVDGVTKGFLIDPVNPRGLYYLDAGYTAAFFDRLRDTLYVLDGVDVRKWDGNTTYMTTTFMSRVYRAPRPTNPSHMRVVADVFPVTVKVYSDRVDAVTHASSMVLRETRTVYNTEPVTLKSGYLSSDFQFEVSVTGAGGVQGVRITDNLAEMSGE